MIIYLSKNNSIMKLYNKILFFGLSVWCVSFFFDLQSPLDAQWCELSIPIVVLVIETRRFHRRVFHHDVHELGRVQRGFSKYQHSFGGHYFGNDVGNHLSWVTGQHVGEWCDWKPSADHWIVHQQVVKKRKCRVAIGRGEYDCLKHAGLKMVFTVYVLTVIIRVYT